MSEVIFKEIANRYTTPLYVFDLDKVNKRMGAIRDKLLSIGSNLCFSIKANPFIVQDVYNLVDYLEVCSPGELQICKLVGVSGTKILYSGVNKGEDDICEAIDYGCAIITAESLRQVELINAEGLKKGRIIQTILRLNGGNQFGMSKADLFNIINKRNEYESLDIIGIHYFVGTQRKNSGKQKAELQMLSGLLDELKDEYGYTTQYVEYGPGLPVPLFQGDDFENTIDPLIELLPAMNEIARKAQLTVEMGRFIAFDCGNYISKVADIKDSHDTHYVIMDGGMHHMNYYGQMMGMKCPIIETLKNTFEHDKTKKYCLCGSLCTTADIISREVELPILSIGDILVFQNAGAYSVTEGMNLFLSRDLPAVVLVKGNKHTLVREHVPAWKLNTGGK